MSHLRCLAIVATNPARLASFYREVFDLSEVRDENGSVFLSDGTFSLAFLPHQPDETQGLSFLGFHVNSIETVADRLAKPEWSAPLRERIANSAAEYKTHDPDGNVIGLSAGGFAVSVDKGPVPIRHIALYSHDPKRLADFYCGVFDMKEVSWTDRSSIFVSDGYFNLALLYQRSDEKLGLNHFGFHVKNNDEMRRRAEKAGVPPGARRPDRIPFAEFRVHDPEGNGFDISQKGWQV